jgi:hypothetical protein
MNFDLAPVVARGLEWLACEQRSDGSYLCLVSEVLDDYRISEAVPAIVPTNIVLSSLIVFQGSEKAEQIKKKAAAFLHEEKNEYWSFNYWFRTSDWYTKEPYPDDLDDTFCALAALYQYDPSAFDGGALAKIVLMLASAEKAEGGPYDMWLVPPEGRKTWNDVDLVVNANVGFFLNLQQIHLPKLTAFIEESIEIEKFEFPYNKIYPAIYFIARWYRGPKVEKLVQLLLKHQEAEGGWENPLRTALALNTLMRLSGNRHIGVIKKGIEYLLRMQQQNGSWPVASFFFQRRTPQKTLYAGSASITTALCLEAIERFSQLQKQSQSEKEGLSEVKIVDISADHLYKKIIEAVHVRLSSCGPELGEQGERMLQDLIKCDQKRQISLLALSIRRALGEQEKVISDELIVQMGVANICGWLAYTVYDDLLDEEGEIARLSAANVCLRTAFELFLEVDPGPRWRKRVREIFDLIDGANSWEFAKTRKISPKVPGYGDYRHLAERSLGHALGPMGLLKCVGYDEDSPEQRHLLRFFEQYLIARQLHDDAHDWQEDLAHGRVNAVATRIVQEANLDMKSLFETSLESLRQLFWKSVVLRICEEIEDHLRLARAALSQLSCFTHPEELQVMLDRLERGVHKTRSERNEALAFLHAYEQPSITTIHP